MQKIFLAGLLVFYCIQQASTSWAYTNLPPSESQSFKKAELVLQLRITETEPLEVNGSSCGARYRAQIAEVEKGVWKYKEISFGFRTGLGIGESYKVFLRASSHANLVELISERVDVDDIQEVEHFLSICESVMPSYHYIHAVDSITQNQKSR